MVTSRDRPAPTGPVLTMSVPPRPPLWEEKVSQFCLWQFAPRLPVEALPDPPRSLAPFERFAIPRLGRAGSLDATWYPAAAAAAAAPGAARGAVLLLHPWMEWGQSYFHRRGRIDALREAGYHALTFDLGGFGQSDGPDGYPDRDVEEALAALARRAGGLPLHLWGVSAGGYWAHFPLARREWVRGAIFEDVTPHLQQWSELAMPQLAPFFASFRWTTPRAYPYLDLRRHAPELKVAATAYVGGALDSTVPPDATRELARLAGGECLIVPGAPHLAAIRLARRQVVALALATFERAAASGGPTR